MTEREKKEIKALMQNEAAEWALRESIQKYREMYTPCAIQLRACYESMVYAGFDKEQALALTINTMQLGVMK